MSAIANISKPMPTNDMTSLISARLTLVTPISSYTFSHLDYYNIKACVGNNDSFHWLLV